MISILSYFLDIVVKPRYDTKAFFYTLLVYQVLPRLSQIGL
ncbi:palindromic element RPE4 domain-containing protein [Rickettsia sibirica]